jgi:broad specificity phosphatase PhoE
MDFAHDPDGGLEGYQRVKKRRDYYGHFYYRVPNGESPADVFDRVSDFLSTLHRDFTKADFPANVIIITHGMAMRLFLMRWFHYSVEQFGALANPRNCEFYLLARQANDRYELPTVPRTRQPATKFCYPP